jgi:predicted O-methyltransferase YrrM
MTFQALHVGEMAALGSNGSPFRLLACSNSVIEGLYRDRVVTLADGRRKPLDVYIPRAEGNFLYSLVRHVRPSFTIEVGMANGLSSLFIAQALKDNGHGSHIAIDPFQFSDWAGAGMTALRRAGLDSLVRLVEKPSYQALPMLEQQGIVAEFFFVDGSHLFDYVITDFLCADRILQAGGLMAFDDSDWPAITQAIRYVLTNRHYQVAFPNIVIEPPRVRPGLFAKLLRIAGRRVPRLQEKLRPDFVMPDERLGVLGRCVVLRKLGADDRDSQSRYHRAF